MKPYPLSHAGRRLLNRRSFLQFAGTGLGGIALTTLL
ncbi:MAG: twin-arginine translocation signal domain-containing protein, partial [Verrucomicrobiota bacterium]